MRFEPDPDMVQFVDMCRKNKVSVGMMVILEPGTSEMSIDQIAVGIEMMLVKFTHACNVTPLIIPVTGCSLPAQDNPRADLFMKVFPIEDLEKVREGF